MPSSKMETARKGERSATSETAMAPVKIDVVETMAVHQHKDGEDHGN